MSVLRTSVLRHPMRNADLRGRNTKVHFNSFSSLILIQTINPNNQFHISLKKRPLRSAFLDECVEDIGIKTSYEKRGPKRSKYEGSFQLFFKPDSNPNHKPQQSIPYFFEKTSS